MSNKRNRSRSLRKTRRRREVQLEPTDEALLFLRWRRSGRRRRGGSLLTVPWTDGQQFTKEQMTSVPIIKINDADPNHKYTIILWDPDAPVKPGFLHYLIVNATGRTQGNIIIPYMGPNPPSGTHRYILTIYRQNSNINITSLNPFNIKRPYFDRDAWTISQGLGHPIGQTHFIVSATK